MLHRRPAKRQRLFRRIVPAIEIGIGISRIILVAQAPGKLVAQLHQFQIHTAQLRVGFGAQRFVKSPVVRFGQRSVRIGRK